MSQKGYPSVPPLLEVRAANREFGEKKKERKDAEKRRRDQKRDEKEGRKKENRAQEKEGKSPILTPNSTPELESPPPVRGEVDYLMWPESDTEGAGGQSPG